MDFRERLGRSTAIAIAGLSLAACGEPAGSPDSSHGGGLQVADLVWVAGRTIEENDVPTALEVLLVRGDGSVAWHTRLQMTVEPGGGLAFISGPRAGRLTYGFRTEAGTTIFMADADEGAATEVATVAELVHGGVIAPDGGAAFLLVEGSRLEVHRIDLEAGAHAELVAVMPRAEPDVQVTPFTASRVTPDGTRLIVERCGPTGACRWAIVSLATGEVHEIEAERAGRIIDLSNDRMLTVATECAVGPCPFVLVDLETGTGEVWDPGANTARLLQEPDGGTLLAYDTSGTGGERLQVVLVDPETFDERPLAAGGQVGAGLGLAREGQDEWAPPGWVVLVPPGSNLGEQGGPVLVNTDDGRVVQLAEPPGG